MSQIKRILFLVPYPLSQAPSQRFRVEAYFDLLKENAFTFDTHAFLDEQAWKVLYQGGSIIQKSRAVFNGFIRRFYKLAFKSRSYDFIFVHREAAPLGPPLFEWFLAKVLRKKIIFDFDDAIWISNISNTNKVALHAKAFWKVASICRWSFKISAGNAFLANWAKKYNKKVVINPTCVDMENRFNQLKTPTVGTNVVIGWTGSHSTLKYLDVIYPILQRLEKEFKFEFLVICNQSPSFSLNSLRYIKWQEATEIEDLLQMDIGIMPLIADAWSEGKCGFKLIQYLSLGIPCVASAVGVNKTIVENGHNGFLCQTEEEWYAALKQLLINEQLRKEMGIAGHEKMRNEYSVHSNAANFLSLFS